MILPFLPEGAHAILLNYMLPKEKLKKEIKGLSHQECAGCSWTMEAELWNHLRNVSLVAIARSGFGLSQPLPRARL